MAVRPEQCTKPAQDEEAFLARLEERIDAVLTVRYISGEPCTVDIDTAASWRVREELIRRYRAAGWSVEFRSDQRDGDSLTFREAASAQSHYAK